MFCPTGQDVLGTWFCLSEPATVIKPQDGLNVTTALKYVKNSTFLYRTNQYFAGRIGDDHSHSDLMVWSSNTSLTSLTDFVVRVTMVPDLSSIQPILTNNYQCKLAITNPTWSPSKLHAELVLKSWADIMLGSLLDIDPIYYPDEIQSILNAITMVAGSQNSPWDSSVASSLGDNFEYGCIDYRTVGHPEVFAILLALILILLVIIVLSVVELVWNRRSKFQPVVASLPVSLLDWQLAMTKKLVNDDLNTARDLAACEYSWDKDTRVVECRNTKVNHAYSEVVQESKIDSKAEARYTFVWNSESKTVEGRMSVVDQVGSSSSDINLSKVDVVVEATPMS